MKTKTNNDINYTLNKISFLQILILGAVSLICFLYNEYTVLNGFLISGIILFSYIQTIRIFSHNHLVSLFGFPVRIILFGSLCAILVHKLHPNLLALFTGFAIGLFIYIFTMWQYAQSQARIEKSGIKKES